MQHAGGVRADLDAGADHVCMQVITAGGMMAPIAEHLPVWRELAKLL